MFKKCLLTIPKGLEFCCTGLTLSIIYYAHLLKLLFFIKIILYHYEYLRHNRPVSVIFIHFSKFQNDISFVEMYLHNCNCQ